MIAIVDYGMGNLRSVQNALSFLGEQSVITRDPAEIATASRLILPGVGAFGDAMANLKSGGLIEVLTREVVEARKPFLGICLGMQLLARSSTEHGFHKGLGWVDADVVRFDVEGHGLKVPHMGWNEVIPRTEHPLFGRLKPEEFIFYFVHSYHMGPVDRSVEAGTCEYGGRFTAVVARDNVFATQFHPEKSQDSGLQILQNFAAWTP